MPAQSSLRLKTPEGYLTATPLPRSFYEHRPELVAPRLLGKLLVHRVHGSALDSAAIVGRIVEVEAYLGPHNDPLDRAAHAHRGITPRNAVLFDAPGYAYVYSIYGQYFCLNVSCEAKGLAGCVLLRALEPVAGFDAMAHNRNIERTEPPTKKLLRHLTSGPSRLCQALGITRPKHNGLDVTASDSELVILDDSCKVPQALVTPRIGIKQAVDWPLRFAVPNNAFVSGPRSLSGRRIPIP